MGRKTCRKGFHGWGHHRDTAGVGWGHRLGVGEGANSLPVGYIRMAPCCPQKVTSELLLKVSGAVRGERRRRRVYPKQRRYVQGNRVSTHMFGEQPGALMTGEHSIVCRRHGGAWDGLWSGDMDRLELFFKNCYAPP